jgi:hypothetical protein
MKETIVEFIEEGTDRVIRTCSLEEYNNEIESINNTIPKEYKFLKKNVMKKIHLFCHSKDSTIKIQDTITWDNDEDLGNYIDNFHDQKNRLYRPYNSYWAFYTTDELTPDEKIIIGVDFGDRIKTLEEFNRL